jgi:predicted transcriptional regulator
MLPPELAAKARQNFARMVKTRTQEDLETADFFKSLSPENKTALVDLLADNEASFAESVSELAQQGKILSEDEFKVLRQTHEDRVKALLGATEYQNYRQHASTRSDRIIVQETTEQLGRPLSEGSTHELLAVLAEERQRLLQSAAPSKEVQLQAMAQMADRIKTRAAEFLQPDEEQLALQEVLERISQVPGSEAAPNAESQ